MDENSRLINLTNINFKYHGGASVLESFDFSFSANERAGLIGPNGSGKTTLSHIIMGLLTPSSGTLEIFGKERKTEADFREVRSGVGFVFQDADDQLFCPTVEEDVAFGPLNLGMSHHDVHHVVKDTLELLGLKDFEKRITYKLSGGEKKLVSLATVLAMKPRMLLLDEPTAGLDEPATERIIEVLKELGLPYLVISHDKEFLRQTVDHCYRMDKGRISTPFHI